MVKNPITPESLEGAIKKYIKLNKRISEENEERFGHSAGDKLEKYAHSMFQKRLELTTAQIKTEWPHIFLNDLLRRHQMYGQDHVKILNNTWWMKLLEKPKIKEYKKNQSAGADLICYYGKEESENLNDVILINVKSSNLKRKGRNPNIISSYKLLRYFSDMCYDDTYKKFLEDIKYWILGFEYDGNEIQNVRVRDLFRLDVSKMPKVNFDAAMQIQWHVDKMITVPEQTNYEFIKKFIEKFNRDWVEHTKKREEKIRSRTKIINRSLGFDRI